MEKAQCLLVDDERLALELLENYIHKMPYLELVTSCSTALDAMQIINQKKVDILFLDIQMPDLSGIEFLRSLKKQPATIFTTAYSEYAMEGYELSVVDYLLKPIEFDRFFKAANKAVEQIQRIPTTIDAPSFSSPAKRDKYFFIKSDNKFVKILFDDILFIEALQKYIRIYTKDKKIITLLSLSKIQSMISEEQFARIHRSYLINIDQIDHIEGNMVRIKDHNLPISKGQKDQFMSLVIKKGFLF